MVSGRLYGDGLPFTLRPVQYTIAPASPSARAMPRPAPRVAPATTATRPASGFFAMLPGWRRRGEASIDERREPDAREREPFVDDRKAAAIVRLVDCALRRHERGLRERVRFHRPF